MNQVLASITIRISLGLLLELVQIYKVLVALDYYYHLDYMHDDSPRKCMVLCAVSMVWPPRSRVSSSEREDAIQRINPGLLLDKGIKY